MKHLTQLNARLRHSANRRPCVADFGSGQRANPNRVRGICLLMLLLAQGVEAQVESSLQRVVDRDAHSRTSESTFTEVLGDGRTVTRTNRWVELMPGGHYIDRQTGQWTETKEEVRIFQDVLVADQGPHQVIFNKSFEAPGTLDISADGRRWRGQLVGIAYTDYASGNSQLIAEPQASAAALIQKNQVAYLDALRGPFRADVVYSYEAGGLEQFVILNEQPPPPGEYQCNEATSFLEVWTEWLEAPQPTKQITVVSREPDPARRAMLAEPDITDEFLDFGGGLCMPRGSVFPLDGDQLAAVGDEHIPALKNWLRMDGRTFLIERIAYSDIKRHLQRLPQAAAARNAPVVGQPKALLAGARPQIQRPFPPPRKQVAAVRPAVPLQVAQVSLPRQGLVLDWALLNSLTNATLEAGVTYYVSNQTVTFTGTTRLESCVVKFSTNFTLNRLLFAGPIDCATAPGFPMYLTGRDDNSIGEVLPNSTGYMGTSKYAARAIELNGASTTYSLHDLRFRNCDKALTTTGNSATYILSHSQIGQATIAFYNLASSVKGYVRNVLVHDAGIGLNLNTTGANHLEHVTFHRVVDFRNSSGAGTVAATNCLFICTTNYFAFSGDSANVITNHNDSGIFTTLGLGQRYLASSIYRDIGTANIDPVLAADRKRRSNWPPLLLTNDITLDTVLWPQVQRDTGLPDLGYAYDPLDVVLSGVSLGASLTLTNGVSVGIYGATGLYLLSGAKLISGGTPENMNRICPYYVVQEGATNWGAAFSQLMAFSGAMTSYPEVDLRFTELPLLRQSGGTPSFMYTYSSGPSRLTLRDCRLFGSSFQLIPNAGTPSPPTQISVGFTNNAFEAISWYFNMGYASDETPVYLHLRNNLFYRGALSLTVYDPFLATWYVHDNFFFTNNLTCISYPTTNSHNGYYATPTLTNSLGNNKTITAAAFETGWLGGYYYPTNAGAGSLTDLVNAGSRYATNAGLHHFTTATNQTNEAGSMVDIGFHFVAVNASGQPFDYDGDGLPDYLEDANGNGSPDAGETGWQGYNSFFGLTGTPGLQVFTPLK